MSNARQLSYRPSSWTYCIYVRYRVYVPFGKSCVSYTGNWKSPWYLASTIGSFRIFSRWRHILFSKSWFTFSWVRLKVNILSVIKTKTKSNLNPKPNPINLTLNLNLTEYLKFPFKNPKSCISLSEIVSDGGAFGKRPIMHEIFYYV